MEQGLAVHVEPTADIDDSFQSPKRAQRVRAGGFPPPGPSGRQYDNHAHLNARAAAAEQQQTMQRVSQAQRTVQPRGGVVPPSPGGSQGPGPSPGADKGLMQLPLLPRAPLRIQTPPSFGQHGRMMPHGALLLYKDQRSPARSAAASTHGPSSWGFMPRLTDAAAGLPRGSTYSRSELGADLAEPQDPEAWLAEFQRTRVEGMRRWRRSQRQAQSLFKNKLKQNEQQWLASRNKVQRFEFSYSQKRALRRWFDSMDADGSGDISVNELADALLSTGLTRQRVEAERLFYAVDVDGTGEIDFDEFLDVLNPTQKGGSDMLSTENLQEFISDKHVEDNLEIGSKVNEKRRKLLLETITNLYANPTGAVDMDEKALLRRNKSAAQVDGAARREAQGLEKEKEKERNDKQSFLSCLLEAVERWNDRERAQEARAVREVDSYNED
mmetsp:Transcript_18854/g.35957  ORF Transcript_18854/g.35957 Transcript_18854/m.35957 type:complete len:440 (-) Transcript_18854:299-1618(-)|eukprot:CAMPEP_0114247056 /NCGR_PEP_ID=MMETSP0058-20121206/12812_1 /TAXON_ID=36894 /ORGANISM="Pyramimonas parkeae, CCMP726" /LENGTH=439 /DNA_ID=CAMNT_0001360323 /DNA_START=206 /DNA_END=1525 /DNA_ORIENTATION=-